MKLVASLGCDRLSLTSGWLIGGPATAEAATRPDAACALIGYASKVSCSLATAS